MSKTMYIPAIIPLVFLAGAMSTRFLGDGADESKHPFASADPGVAREAVDGFVRRGEDAVAELSGLLASHDARISRRAKEALARITGQWGSDGTGISWFRSVEEIPASRVHLPIVHLQLFGNLDEEFC